MVVRRQNDPILLELIRNRLESICDEMAITVVRTARSFIVKEAMDFSTGLCNAQGELVAQGLCLPLHLGSVPPAMAAIRSKFDGSFQPGDVCILNDPYAGGTHLPDVFVVKPVFVGGKLAGFAVVVAHQIDIGGRVAGGNASDSTEIFQEGLRIPPLKLYAAGVSNDTLFTLIKQNVRVPDKVIGDLLAEVAACKRGEEQLVQLAERYGLDLLEQYLQELLAYTEQLTRAELRALPDGSWEFTDYLDDDGIDPDPIAIHAKVTKRSDEIEVDFSGTSPQVKGAINLPFAFSQSAVYTCVRSVLNLTIPNNAGFFRPIKVQAPLGSFVNCTSPAPVAARGLGGIRTCEAIFGALAQMLPDRVFACESAGDTGVTIAGYHRDGRPFVHLEFLYGTWGGGPLKDGIDGSSSVPINYSNTPVEVVELEQPIRIEQYSFWPDTGGPGKYRGGLGLVREYRLVGVPEAILQVRSDRQKTQPYGLWGGKSGSKSENILSPATEAKRLPSKFMIHLKEGDVFRHIMAGGGGWGDPLERDPDAVLEDVLNEKISHSHAREQYGVIIDTRHKRVNDEATQALRAEMRRARSPQP